MKIARQCVSNVVGGARQVIEAWDIAVETLVDPKQPQEVGWRLVGGGASFTLPVRRVEVVALGQDCALPNIKRLGKGVQVQEPASQFEVGVCNGTIWIFVGDETARDVLRPQEPPHQGLSRTASTARDKVVAREPHPSRTNPGGVMMSLRRGRERD